jgi:two-component system, NtrC family, response regulator
MAKILIIDDEEKLRGLLARIIAHEGHEVQEAGDARTGLKKLAQDQDTELVFCDVKLPDAHGVALVPELKKANPMAEVILLTAYGNIPDGVQAIKNGAFDYLTKGDDNDRILPLLERALEKSRLSRRIRQLEKELGRQRRLDQLIGQSQPMRQAVSLAGKVAATDTTVLLNGETGTGKEVFAQAIHQESNRSKQAFVAINCAAFGHELLESEMFGHKAGAFTGAQRDKAGLFEEADKGTLFLDEIGEMAPDLQAKLLRVLETGEYLTTRCGSGISAPICSIASPFFRSPCRPCANAPTISGHWRSILPTWPPTKPNAACRNSARRTWPPCARIPGRAISAN